jgi:uncharacterized protein YbjT (DUF2867 family)
MSNPLPSAKSTARKRTVLLAGGTGLVGQACLRLLARDDRVAEIRLLTRRPSGAAHTGLGPMTRVVEHVVDFERLDTQPDLFAVDAVLCALGTTIRVAGTQAAFRKVDYEYPLQIGKLALRHGASRYVLVSAIGADARAHTFYSRVKGEVEDALRKLGYPSLTILRPSFLMGERTETRPLESVTRRLGLLLPLKWRSIPAETVARALIEAALGDTSGVTVIENDGLHHAMGGTH